MPPFNAQEELAALEPPEFVAPNGRHYVGVIVGHGDWEGVQARFQRIAAGEDAAAWPELRRVIGDVARLCFPRPWWQLWPRSVASWVASLPPALQMRAFNSFVASQVRAMRAIPGTSPSSPSEPAATDGSAPPG